jgi:membrane protein
VPDAARTEAGPTGLASLRHAWHRQGSLRLSQVAAGVAFWLVIAVFPAGLAVVNLVGLILDQEEVADFVGRFVAATPGSLGDILATQLQAVALPTPGTLIPDTLLVIVAVWTVSTAMHHLVRGIQTAGGDPHRRPIVVRALAIGLAVGLILALGLLAWVLDATTLLRSIAGYLASAVVLSALTAAIYWLAAGRSMRYRDALPGAVLAAVGFVLIGGGLELYASLAGNLHLIYGAVAGLVVSMLGIWLAMYAVLLGALLNAEVRSRRDP